MSHAFITVVIPFDRVFADRVERYLRTLGNPPRSAIKRRLDSGQFVHFMSMSVLRQEASQDEPYHLIIEASADGTVRSALERLAIDIKPQLDTVLLHAGINVPDGQSLDRFLESYHVEPSNDWGQTPGLNFDGTPDMSVMQIRQEEKLAKAIAGMLDETHERTALATLERIRDRLWSTHAYKWAFFPAPATILEGKPPVPPTWTIASFLFNGGGPAWSAFMNFFWPLAIVALFASIFTGLFHGFSPAYWSFILLLTPLPFVGVTVLWPLLTFDLVVSVVIGFIWGFGAAFHVLVLGFIALSVLAFGIVFVLLRWAEARDVPDDEEPDRLRVATYMKREGRAAQSHLAAAATVKPGWLRHLTLRIGLWLAGIFAAHFSRPGFLTEIGVIHFARWILIPGTNKLVFLSNYDGAWQTYLEDFIVRTPRGVTIVWTNTKGFPRTKRLSNYGAADGDRLKRWIRRQQFPTWFWYSAYPGLTMQRVRANADIRKGIAQAKTNEEAERWLALFGAPPPTKQKPELTLFSRGSAAAFVSGRPLASPAYNADARLELENISTFAFGALKVLPYAYAVFLRFTDRPGAKAWLSHIEPEIGYGAADGGAPLTIVGLSQTGLTKIGLSRADLKTFPVAFQDGASASTRALVLRDAGRDTPSRWDWGGPNTPVDAVMLLYARSPDTLENFARHQAAHAVTRGVVIVHAIPLGPPFDKEQFGFLDGISQPVIRGVPRANYVGAHHLVEPGEFILGYPNNAGYYPPSPFVDTVSDRHGLLRPIFADPDPRRALRTAPDDKKRDLGRNGTYLVVRQLDQNAPALDHFLRHAAVTVARDPRAPRINGRDLPDWLGARMMGRWKNGKSVLRHATQPANGKPDNDYLFDDDPGGAHCPFGAHTRRANPRMSLDPGEVTELEVTNRHRIIRVGRPYPSSVGGNQAGLLFMCLNSDIERQFEFIQQNWLHGRSFHSLQSEGDPLITASRKDSVFTIPTRTGPLRIKCTGSFLRDHGLESFITVKGTGYFFIPGRMEFRYLARL